MTVEDAAAGAPPYVVVPYLDRMDFAYAAADLALCRAGANTVVERPRSGCRLRTCRSATASRVMARPVVQAGGGLLVDDPQCTAAWVRATLTPLLTDPERLATMGRAAESSGRRDADERLVDLALEAAAAGRTGRGGRRW